MLPRFYFLFLFIFVFSLLGLASSLEFVLPNSFDGSTISLYPNTKTTVEFLQTFEGNVVFVDSLFCEGVSCSTVKTNGPYFLFDLTAGNVQTGKVSMKYHYKGKTEELSKEIGVEVSPDLITVVPFVATDFRLLDKYPLKVLVKNDSDAKLSGEIYTNFPDDILSKIVFSIEPKSQAEYTAQFLPKNAGLFDMDFYLKLESQKEKKIFTKTIFVKKDLFNLFAMSNTSFLPTNPQFELYSSILSLFYLLK